MKNAPLRTARFTSRPRTYASAHAGPLRSSIADRVTVAEVLKIAGWSAPNRRGFLLCPLHTERTPSFHVVADRGWRCFGCGKGGGIFDLVVALGLARDRAAAAKWLERVAQ